MVYLHKIWFVSKFDPLIYSYLVAHKELSVEKIGHFTVDKPLPLADKENPHPHLFTSITFVADKKAATSVAFIDFCASELQKKNSLITSDIESYFEQARQFINIGKPFTMPGVGMVSINKAGNYQFIESDSAIKLDTPTGASTAYETEAETRKGVQNQQRVLMRVAAIAIGALIIGVISFLVYRFIADRAIEQVANPADTASPVTQRADTTVLPAIDTVNNAVSLAPATPTNDTATYKFIFEQTGRRVRAETRTMKLRAFGNFAQFDSIRQADTMVYRLFLEVRAVPTDTLKKKDSLQRYLKRNIIIE